ncbi:hypothetical protein ALNOE001_10480 [Candidatus Methanobinarius endosymbioticus]|uniref:Uncharacterized protein n=1 Tax=Candidatus Methanobinarius endosymbioticus TaxID=2006182 RepID=A0A366MBM9_9EURY|nr:hypothetical protein ALNOE001_10480 [Candidatus Methanobinarius endosymbioticus]
MINSLSNIIDFQFLGDIIYQITLDVSKGTNTLVVRPVSGTVGDNVQLVANLTAYGNPISGVTVYFFVNSVIIGSNVTGVDGIAIFHYLLELFDTNYFAEYAGNDTFNGSRSVAGTLTVSKINTNLVVSSVSGVVGDVVQLVANLTSNGNPIVGSIVDFFVTGVFVGSNVTGVDGIDIFHYILKAPDNTYSTNYSINYTFTAIQSRSVVLNAIDYSGLQDLIDSLNTLNSEDYTPDSWASLQSVLSHPLTMTSVRGLTSQQELILLFLI